MASSKLPRVPKYRRHPNGQAFIEHRSIRTPSRRLYLGLHGSAESHKKYAEAISQVLAVGDATPLPAAKHCAASIDECCLAYLAHAENYYGKSSEFHHVKTTCEFLSAMFGSMDGRKFGPRALVTLQSHLVGIRTLDDKPRFSRSHINRLVSISKRLIRWCCRQEIVPTDLYARLQCVEGLKAGKSDAPDHEAVKPVPREHVDALLPFLTPTIAAMVQVQYLCGMRPGEVCRIKGADLITSGPVWLCRIPRHKSTWRGQQLVKAVPKKAQEILREFLSTNLDAYLFSPIESERKRLGKVVRKRKKKHRDHYDTGTYQQGIDNGFLKIKRRNQKAKDESELITIPHWHANQLRHLIGTEISQALGQQAAQRWLGHTHLKTTEIYAEKNVTELVAIALELERRTAS